MSVMASPSEQKIDIAASVRAAYTFVMDNGRLAVDLAWLPFAILVGAEFVAWLVGGGGWFGMILALLVRAGGFAVFGTAFMVRWHRFVLLGETTSESLFPPGWTPFFLTVREHTLTGMFASPKHGGNFNKAGWKLIGFEDTLNFKAPFGYYDALALKAGK